MRMLGLILRDRIHKYVRLDDQIFPKSHSSILYKTVKPEYNLRQKSLGWSNNSSKNPQVTRIYMHDGSTPTPVLDELKTY